MAIMTHAKFHFNWLMLTSIFGIWASEPPPGPGERLKRPGLIGLKFVLSHRSNSLRSEMYPCNSWLMMPKSLFTIKKCVSEPKLYPYIFKPFLPKRKIFVSNFCDLSFER